MAVTHSPSMQDERSPLLDRMTSVEDSGWLDRPLALLERPARAVDHGRARWLLGGTWLGHALHPLLTDFPLGCWIGSGLLDLVGGRGSRRASQRLVGFGLLFVAPTAAAGLSDWAMAADRTRHVGVVHAALNGAAASAYVVSWAQRRRSHHVRGVMAGFVGAALAWVSGYLGGHMSLRQRAGSGEPAVPEAAAR
jgi:uncharacterized membrane protein